MIALVVALTSSLVLALLIARGIFLGYPKAGVRCAMLSRKEQAIVAACADAMFPAGGAIPLSGTEAGLVHYMDEYVARMPRGTRPLVRLLFLFTEHGPWVFGPRRARFTRLRPEERIRALEAMQKSGVYFRRVAFLSVRAMLTMGYLANAEVARAMGMQNVLAPFEEAFA